MAQANNKLNWCIDKAKKEGEKHRGINVIAPNQDMADKHIIKAQNDMKVMLSLMKGNMLDWATSASFYTMYHCLLAILFKHGYESRNQECTFAAVETLINEKKIYLSIDKLRRISAPDRTEALESETIIEYREDAQYGTETAFDLKKVQQLRDETIDFLEESQRIIEL
jgi:uncharacterized protein (UPF0332 family)